MKVINQDNMWRIYGDSLETYNALPPKVYYIRFAQLIGFYLEGMPSLEIKEEKIYGVHEEKCKKVLSAFSAFQRNLGVILSGDKGIGKSLFAKLLGIKAMEAGYPLIIVDKYTPGVASFIQSLEQETVVMFDEFDKTFGDVNPDGAPAAQTELLSLFDGMAGGKKLFVITCNNLNRLNEFLVNRPGRFHYHFRFDYPDGKEITEYMQDKLPEKYWGEIPEVVSFSSKVRLNYDCLRAITFEISQGYPFKEAIQDLNIINLNGDRFTLTLHYENGIKINRRNCYFDSFSEEEEDFWFSDKNDYRFAEVSFVPNTAKWNDKLNIYCILGEDMTIKYEPYDSDDEKDPDFKSVIELVNSAKSSKLLFMTLKREYDKSIHYLV